MEPRFTSCPCHQAVTVPTEMALSPMEDASSALKEVQEILLQRVWI